VTCEQELKVVKLKVFKSFIKPLENLDKRVKVTIAAQGLSGFGNRMTNRYTSLYVMALGASPTNLGLLTSISQAARSLISVPMGWAVENYSVKKVMLLNLALFTVHLAILGFAGNWLILIPAYIISTRMVRMGPLADIIYVTAVEPERRGTIISISRVIGNILGVFAPMIAAFVVTHFGGLNAQGIRPLYFIQLAITIFIILIVARSLPPTLGRVDKREKSGLSLSRLINDYRDSLKGEKYLQRWVVLRIIMSFNRSLVTPFIVLWLVESKGATPYILGIIGSTSLIVTLLLQIPAGHLADKYGRKKVYFLINSLTYIGTLIAILAPEPNYLILAGIIGGYATGVLGGGIGGVAMPLFVTWWWESVPEEKRGRFFGIEGLFGLAGIPSSILGGILWQQGYQMHILLFPIIVIRSKK
jgi:MFS family permease